jgi:hypothetical protein
MAWYDPTSWFSDTTTTTLPEGVEAFDTSNYWQADEQTTGSVTKEDVNSFLKEYPEYTSFFTSPDIASMLSSLGTGAKNIITNAAGKIDPTKIASLAGGLFGGLAGNASWAQANIQKTGYQGGIPSYTGVREAVQGTYDPTRRPGSRGQEYFTQQQFVSPSDTATAQATAAQQAAEAEARNKAREAEYKAAQPRTGYAQGGIAGYYLGGKTDGMADQIPATIGGKQPAKLSDGEFVIPADVVSHLGNGNSSAGAERLYSMMDKIRTARTGTKKQGKQINPNKYLPG